MSSPFIITPLILELVGRVLALEKATPETVAELAGKGTM